LAVEPNNSGFASDNLDEHIEKARRIATRDFYIGNFVARELSVPLLVPVFPRPMSDWKIYTHALDRDVMLQKGTSLERIDLQLIAMFEDAREKLNELGYSTHDQFLMIGFSASATFANRFSAIHPERVKAVAAGGLNGLLLLPLDSLQNTPLPYPIGTNDFEMLFGKPFQDDLFGKTPQFYFMGGLDDNDAILFDDGYEEEERQLIFKTLGREMQPQRWESCTGIYNENNIQATFYTYNDIGHEHPGEVKEDIITFFKSVL
jgi:pimeloyl-ACP methyl ester carboxylesterase